MKHYIAAALFIFCAIAALNCSKENATNISTPGAGGSTARFTILGNYMYVVDNTGLKTFDITDPLNPTYRGKKELGLNIETIFPYGNKLFIGSSTTMYIYSTADPSDPQLVASAQYQIQMACDPVVANETVAYATLRVTSACGAGSSQLVVYNIQEPSQPKLEMAVPLNEPYGLGMQGNALYVCDRDGLIVFDISSQYTPEQKFQVGDQKFFDVIPYGDILIAQVEGGMALYDIATDPLKPAFIEKINN
ncbi:MAG: LVIVD repeat-containing protein [Agriterribacter sp.]